jgi:MFS family permease
MFAAMAAPKVVTNPVWGRFSDRVGRRPVLVVTTLGTIGASVAWALAPGVGWLVFSRLLIGLFGAQAVLAQAVASDVTTPARRAAGMALLGAAFGIALAFGPLSGGWVAARYSYAAVGWLCAGLQAASLAVIVFALPETRPAAAANSARGARAFDFDHLRAQVVSRPGVTQLLLVTFVMTLGMSQLNSTYPLVAEHYYGFTPVHAGYALSFLGLVGALAQGGVRPAVARWGEQASVTGALLVLSAGFAIIAFEPPLWALIAATALIAAGMAVAVSCLTAMLSRRVGAEDQGAALGVNQAATGLGRAGGAMLGGALYAGFASSSGPAAPYGAATAIVLAALLILLPLPRAVAAPRDDRDSNGVGSGVSRGG